MAVLTVPPRSLSTMAQGPMVPWNNDDEAEEYAADPRAFLLERSALWRDGAKFFHYNVIAATYYLPSFQILANGQKFHYPQSSHDEALWQGKVGLVLAKGPMAFVSDNPSRFKDQDVKIGDWIQWDIHDARQFTMRRMHCRILQDTQVIAVLNDPRSVY